MADDGIERIGHWLGAVHLLDDGAIVATGTAALDAAAELLSKGEVVAIPTDTVYGLAAAIDAPRALSSIFAIKGREQSQTLPVLVPDRAAAERLLGSDDLPFPTGSRLLALAHRFWPGALTVALPARSGLPDAVTATDGTVGIRVPDNPVSQVLLLAAGGALAVTSANRSGRPPLLDAGSVQHVLGAAGLRWVLDGGPADAGAGASTVVGQDGDRLLIYREGAISSALLQRAWSMLVTGPHRTAE